MSERDIVERLQAPAYWISGSSEGHDGENEAPLEAADEILRLRAELADAKRAGWIAGRDAAREVCRDVILVCDGDIDEGGGNSLIAQWRRDGASDCFKGIVGLEPPA